MKNIATFLLVLILGSAYAITIEQQERKNLVYQQILERGGYSFKNDVYFSVMIDIDTNNLSPPSGLSTTNQQRK